MLIKPQWLKKLEPLIQIIRNNNAEAKFVGGCVRDSILGREVNDFDLATTLLPQEIIDILSKNNIKVIPTGLKHGTVTAIFNKIPVEITTLRKDAKCDGRHAEVEFTDSWKCDAKRRDFTFNALYLSLEGKIDDYFSGVEDLKERKLNFVGSPAERIQEDHLRILRAFRFYTNLENCKIDNSILQICQKYKKLLNNLSGERIQTEMFKLLSYKSAIKTLIIMQNYNILEEALNTHINFDAINAKKSEEISSYIVKLAALLKNSTSHNKEELVKWLFKRWRFNKNIYKTLSILVKNNLFENIKKNLVEFGRENSISMLEIEYITNKINKDIFMIKKSEINNLEIPQFPIMGRDLKNKGISGKEIGDALNKLHNIWEESNFTFTKEQLLNIE